MWGKYSNKELSVFQGVLKLYNEGHVFESLRMQDIADASGIPKGTIYEYFSSKEEIIAKAILYNIATELTNITRKIAEKTTFQDKLFSVFDWLIHNHMNKSLILLFSADDKSAGQMHSILKENGNGKLCGGAAYINILASIIDTGIQEGILSRQDNMLKFETTLFMSIIPILQYIKKEEDTYKNISHEQLKKYSYEIFIRIWETPM